MVAKQKTPNNDVNDLNLVDVFAGMALIGLLSKNGFSLGTISQAYVIANHMIEERQKNER
jgi:hypothetical protein